MDKDRKGKTYKIKCQIIENIVIFLVTTKRKGYRFRKKEERKRWSGGVW